MKEQNELTPRKEAKVISLYGGNVDFEAVTEQIREESLEPVKEITLEALNEVLTKDYGLIITIEKCIDMPQGNGDTFIKVESVADYNYVQLEPSKISGLMDKLADIGYPVMNEAMREIISAFIDIKMKERDYQYTHQKVGWGFHLKQKMIKMSTAISEQGKIQSQYTGRLNLSKKGTVDEFIKGIKKLVIGNHRLELAFISGVCGLVVQELDKSDINIVINFVGNSSSGKTQTTKLALTLFGDPNELFLTFNSTENRTEKEMSEYQVVPVILDDKLVGVNGQDSKRQSKAIINDIFRYASGHVKGRMYDDDSYNKHYCPIIISTEESIINIMKSSDTKGQFFRMFEVSCKRGELTSSKEHSKQLEAFMRNNYGHAIDVFAEWMIKNSIYGDKLKDKFDGWHTKIVDAFGQVDYADRMANRIAVIMLAGELLNACFDFKIDLDGIQNLLMESVKAAFGKAFEEDAQLKSLKEYIGAYPDNFADCRVNCNRYKHLGQYKKNEYGYNEVLVEPDALRYILSGKEPQDYLNYLKIESEGEKFETEKKKKPVEQISLLQILRTWRSKGYLISGRKSGKTTALTSQETLFNDSKQTSVYIIQFKEGE